jgi:hypothetical protein
MGLTPVLPPFRMWQQLARDHVKTANTEVLGQLLRLVLPACTNRVSDSSTWL